ncbi:MAG: TIGR04372 family glycosyltransferase [Nitrospirae bacterium]|nr:TIGR04372 family glycosyltransferase [Magnetococcales bacterium]HAT51330.1 hypothetical protein [Alphaproteobacteria bacterium]
MKKKIRKIFKIIIIILAVPAVLLIRLLRPWKKIRLGKMQSSRIGFITGIPLIRWNEKMAGLREQSIDLCFPEPFICNQRAWEEVKRKYRCSSFFGIMFHANRLLPGYRNHEIIWGKSEDTFDILSQSPPSVSFSSQEEEYGASLLEKMGVPAGASFVCFFNRDPHYLDQTLGDAHGPGGWNYHNYRDSNIDNYIPAMEEMVRRGYYVLRMGAVAKEPLKAVHERIVDYAFYHRSDFMDLFLFAKCCFVVGTNSGPYSLATTLCKPVAMVNTAPLLSETNTRGFRNVIICPKRYFSTTLDRFMTLREILDCGADSFARTEDYERHQIRLIENEPELIIKTAIEVEERFRGGWVSLPKYEQQQEKFWEILGYKMPEPPLWRIGAHVLELHPELLL